MYGYEYARACGEGCHCSPDQYCIDHHGEPLTLFERIIAEFPTKHDPAGGKYIQVNCHDTVCTIEFTDELSGEDETTLDGLVATHKAVEDWPPE